MNLDDEKTPRLSVHELVCLGSYRVTASKATKSARFRAAAGRIGNGCFAGIHNEDTGSQTGQGAQGENLAGCRLADLADQGPGSNFGLGPKSCYPLLAPFPPLCLL